MRPRKLLLTPFAILFSLMSGTALAQTCPIGVNYCQTSPNSTGVAAVMSAQGSATGGFGTAFCIQASQLPPQAFGLFFHGPNQAALPLGNGTLCLGTNLIRLSPQMSLGGIATRSLDGTPFIAGQTRNFQFWFRDTVGAGFNTTDGLELTFDGSGCPYVGLVPTALGQANTTLVGTSVRVSNLGSSGLDGVSLAVGGEAATQALASGIIMKCDGINLSQLDAQVEFNPCSFFGQTTTPNMRFGCCNKQGNLTLSFSLDVAPNNCTDVTIFLFDGGNIVGIYNCPAGQLGQLRAAVPGQVPQIIELGTSKTAGLDVLRAKLSANATFNLLPSHPLGPLTSPPFSELRLRPNTCTTQPIFGEIDCLNITGANMTELVINDICLQ